MRGASLRGSPHSNQTLNVRQEVKREKVKTMFVVFVFCLLQTTTIFAAAELPGIAAAFEMRRLRGILSFDDEVLDSLDMVPAWVVAWGDSEHGV